MERCSRCGEYFDLSYVKRFIGRNYGAGSYDDYYPDGDVCLDCAIEEVSADWATGAEIMELIGNDDEWD